MSAAHPAPHPAAAAVVLDPRRLATVRRTGLLDTPADPAFDRFTRLAARLLGVPFALVTLVDGERQFCKSAHGIPAPDAPGAPMPSLPFSHSFCQHVVAAGAPVVLGDARADPLHAANGAIADFGAVAYAGVPLVAAGGAAVGTVCAVDTAPRAWGEGDVALLADLAAAVGAEMELRRALHESEEARGVAHLLLSASPDAFLAVGADGRCTYASERALERIGRPADAVVGRPLGEHLPPTERAGVAALLGRVRATGAPFEAELLVTTPGMPNGCWVALHATPNAAGGAALALRDVTERRAAQAALRASEARFRAVVEQSPEPVVVHRAGRVVYANPSSARLIGEADHARLAGTSVFDFLHADDHTAAARNLAGLAAGEPTGEAADYRLVRRDGTTVDVECVSAVVEVDGAPAVQSLLRDVTERNRLQRALTHQAFHDPLTGLANRALFLDRLRRALERRRAGAAPAAVAVVFLDLDDFKTVNDSLGHAHGDALLREVAARLQRATRGCDTVARLGGDEFAVLLDHMTGPADATRVVERVAAALDVPVPLGEGAAVREVRAGASVGVAHARGDETAEELLRDADVAMYRAKSAGKGRHAVFEPAMHAALVARLELEADLRAALADPAASGLWLAYQPIVDAPSGAVRGFEVLARWDRRSSDGSTRAVPPAEFVPLAEASGLVATLGRWVLAEACAQLARWRRALPAGARLPRVSVNVSGRQLDDVEALVADVRAALDGAGLPPDALLLEMTESVLMQHTDDTLRRLGALKALGVELAIDDFGTGYSSLAYLQRFPVDVLKLDKSFVDGVAEEAGDWAITRAVIALAEALGLSVVAEGVEHEAQRRTLAALGCGAAQGYLFARPLPAQAAGALLLGASAPSDSAPSASA